MGAHRFDMDEYLTLTGGDPKIRENFEPNLELLTALVARHVFTVHYQNYDLLTQKKILDMTPGALLQRLLISGRGGMCYETSELMFHVLTEFKFDVKRVPVVVLAGMPFDETQPKDHNVLIVFLEGKEYLVDVGFGYNSLRGPIEFNFRYTEEKSLAAGEKYQLVCAEEYYQLNFWLKGDWASFYRFKRPMKFINFQESMEYYHNLVKFPGTTVIRDLVLFVGVVLEGGRFGFSCDYDTEKGATNFSLLTVKEGESESQKLDVETFRETISRYLKIDINYSNQNNIIKFL
uniref:arylamine N-acetyltransferase n=1 Tax=Lygus hesperus TaxID=30085 RepID=A0A146L7M7_LYGHE